MGTWSGGRLRRSAPESIVLLVLLLVLLESGVSIRPVTGLIMISPLVFTDLLVLT